MKSKGKSITNSLNMSKNKTKHISKDKGDVIDKDYCNENDNMLKKSQEESSFLKESNYLKDLNDLKNTNISEKENNMIKSKLLLIENRFIQLQNDKYTLEKENNDKEKEFLNQIAKLKEEIALLTSSYSLEKNTKVLEIEVGKQFENKIECYSKLIEIKQRELIEKENEIMKLKIDLESANKKLKEQELEVKEQVISSKEFLEQSSFKDNELSIKNLNLIEKLEKQQEIEKHLVNQINELKKEMIENRNKFNLLKSSESKLLKENQNYKEVFIVYENQKALIEKENENLKEEIQKYRCLLVNQQEKMIKDAIENKYFQCKSKGLKIEKHINYFEYLKKKGIYNNSNKYSFSEVEGNINLIISNVLKRNCPEI